MEEYTRSPIGHRDSPSVENQFNLNINNNYNMHTIRIIMKNMVYQPHINMYIKGNIPITMLVFQPPLTKTVKPIITAE